jgi:uncharacterized protein (DUF4415 family)
MSAASKTPIPLALTIEDDSAAGEARRYDRDELLELTDGRRMGAALPAVGKTRITIYQDEVILEKFKAEPERTGKGYQTLINDALARHISSGEHPVTAAQVRRILREELAQTR